MMRLNSKPFQKGNQKFFLIISIWTNIPIFSSVAETRQKQTTSDEFEARAINLFHFERCFKEPSGLFIDLLEFEGVFGFQNSHKLEHEDCLGRINGYLHPDASAPFPALESIPASNSCILMIIKIVLRNSRKTLQKEKEIDLRNLKNLKFK